MTAAPQQQTRVVKCSLEAPSVCTRTCARARLAEAAERTHRIVTEACHLMHLHLRARASRRRRRRCVGKDVRSRAE
jgi:hypothetical protein